MVRAFERTERVVEQQNQISPVGHRRARVGRRVAAGVVLCGSAMLAACSTVEDGGTPAVTLPELDTTTTTSVAPGHSPGAEEGQAPPPPAWTVQLGGPGDDLLRDVAALDDTVHAVGSTTGTIDDPGTETGGTTPEPPDDGTGTPGTASGTDVLVATVHTSGELQSAQRTGTDGEDVANGVSPTAAGLLTCGSTTGQLGTQLGGSTDLWCGQLRSGEADPIVDPLQLGGTDVEEITGIAGEVDQERAYASGRVGGLLPGAQDPTGRGLGGGDAIALQLSSTGTPIWARQFGTPAEDGASAAAVTNEGDGIIVGYTDGDLGRASGGGRDAWISRFDPAGRQRWITQFGSAGSDVLTSVTPVGEARRGTELFVGAGTTDGELGGPDAGASGDDGSFGSGPDDEGDGAGPRNSPGDAFAAAFGTDGALAWTRTLGSEAQDSGEAVVGDGALVYVAGTTRGELGEHLPEAGPGGGSDGFLAALDAASGNVVWVSRFGSAGDEEITSMTKTEDGLLVLAGTTTGQMADTPPGGGIDGFMIAFPLASAGGGAASSV